jgi:choline dehydrogenase
MKEPWQALKGADYEVNDAYYKLWARWPWLRLGPYTSNGAMFSMLYPSRWGRGRADLYCFALLADFHGYFPRYSQLIRKRNYMSWVILKAYTQNRAGRVQLRSNHAMERPAIDFEYFPEKDEDAIGDLNAVVDGIKFVRGVADYLEGVEEEEIPGRHVHDDAQLREFVRNNAWGHHACGTCAIGPDEASGVVDSKFRVHGLDNLRVVDASVFPRIPGYFIVAAVYMIAEKAADEIIASAHQRQS